MIVVIKERVRACDRYLLISSKSIIPGSIGIIHGQLIGSEYPGEKEPMEIDLYCPVAL
jgi:hypothetical protein